MVVTRPATSGVFIRSKYRETGQLPNKREERRDFKEMIKCTEMTQSWQHTELASSH